MLSEGWSIVFLCVGITALVVGVPLGIMSGTWWLFSASFWLCILAVVNTIMFFHNN